MARLMPGGDLLLDLDRMNVERGWICHPKEKGSWDPRGYRLATISARGVSG